MYHILQPWKDGSDELLHQQLTGVTKNVLQLKDVSQVINMDP